MNGHVQLKYIRDINDVSSRAQPSDHVYDNLAAKLHHPAIVNLKTMSCCLPPMMYIQQGVAQVKYIVLVVT